MKFQLASDLHTEFYGGNPPLLNKNPEADVLLLSGDIALADKIEKSREFFLDISSKFDKTFYVLGNHEHYRNNIDHSQSDIEKFFKENKIRNIHILKAGVSYELEGVAIIGDTLWTDVNKGDPVTSVSIQSGMNDYRLIRVRNSYRKLNPDDTRALHLAALEKFEKTLKDYDMKFVVMTHHAPTFNSVSELYKDDYCMNGGYASDLTDFILRNPNIAVWTHGHMHSSSDYMIGNTRVIANPRGYPTTVNGNNFQFENTAYNEGLTFNV